MNRRQLFAFLPALPFIPAAIARAHVDLMYGSPRISTKLTHYFDIQAIDAADVQELLRKNRCRLARDVP
jgi:hypothetical protein